MIPIICIAGILLGVVCLLQQRQIDRLREDHHADWLHLADEILRVTNHQLSDKAGLDGLVKTLAKIHKQLSDQEATLLSLRNKGKQS